MGQHGSWHGSLRKVSLWLFCLSWYIHTMIYITSFEALIQLSEVTSQSICYKQTTPWVTLTPPHSQNKKVHKLALSKGTNSFSFSFSLFHLFNRDNAQHKCFARVGYKDNFHLQSLGRMLLQNYNTQSQTIQHIQYHIILHNSPM